MLLDQQPVCGFVEVESGGKGIKPPGSQTERDLRQRRQRDGDQAAARRQSRGERINHTGPHGIILRVSVQAASTKD